MKLFDLLPDGLVLHSQECKNEAEGTTEQSISYLNKMFKQMFRDINSTIEHGSEAFANFNKIYLKQVGYKIVDQVMHQINFINTQPFSLRKSLDEF